MFKWIGRAVLAGAVCGVLWVTGAAVVHMLKNSQMFTVQTVEVRGVSHTDRQNLKEIYQPLIGENIFTKIEPNALLTDDPWIRKLEMKRVLPNKLVVIVTEEKELLKYRTGNKCVTFTNTMTEIPTDCAGVRIRIAESPLPEEFREFIKLYNENEVLQNSDITIKNGFFTADINGVEFTSTYLPGVFEENYNTYIEKISPRYRKVKSVDVTVKGKVYVKGEING